MLLRLANAKCPDIPNTSLFLSALNEFICTCQADALTDFFEKLFDSYKDVLQKEPQTYVMLEGNIGAGKTTMLVQLMDRAKTAGIRVELVPEPLDFWKSILVVDKDRVKSNIFEHFYDELPREKTRVVVIFQLVALYTRVVTLLAKMRESGSNREFFVSERSFYSDRWF